MNLVANKEEQEIYEDSDAKSKILRWLGHVQRREGPSLNRSTIGKTIVEKNATKRFSSKLKMAEDRIQWSGGAWLASI